MRIIRSLAIAATAGIILATLTGCAVSLTDPDAGTTPDSTVEAPAETPQDEANPEDDAPKETPVTSNSGPTQWSAEVGATRDDAIASVTKTVTCDGELVLGDSETGQFVRIDGPCDHLVLDMDGGFVIAGETTTLDIRGTGNAVFVDTLTTLNVSGHGGAVYWLGSTPAVNDSGVGNVATAG